MSVYTIGGSTYNMACGTTDGTNAYLEGASAAVQIWAWNMTLGEIGIFDHTLSQSDVEELFAARAVW